MKMSQRLISHSEVQLCRVCARSHAACSGRLSTRTKHVSWVLKDELEFIRDQQNCLVKTMALGLTYNQQARK